MLVSCQVYDVTKFLHNHPGGVAQLLVGAGRDVSQVFGMYHKPETYKYACACLYPALCMVLMFSCSNTGCWTSFLLAL